MDLATALGRRAFLGRGSIGVGTAALAALRRPPAGCSQWVKNRLRRALTRSSTPPSRWWPARSSASTTR